MRLEYDNKFDHAVEVFTCDECRKDFEYSSDLKILTVTDGDGGFFMNMSLCENCLPAFEADEQEKTAKSSRFGQFDESKLTPRSNQLRRTSDIAKAARLELARKSARMFATMNLVSVIIGLILGYIYAISEVSK